MQIKPQLPSITDTCDQGAPIFQGAKQPVSAAPQAIDQLETKMVGNTFAGGLTTTHLNSTNQAPTVLRTEASLPVSTPVKKFLPSLGSSFYLEISPQNTKSQIGLRVTYPKEGMLGPNKPVLYNAMRLLTRDIELVRCYFDEDGQQCLVPFESFPEDCWSPKALATTPNLHDPLKPKIQLEFSQDGDQETMRIGIPHELTDGKSGYLGLITLFNHYIEQSYFPKRQLGKLLSSLGGVKIPEDFSLSTVHQYAQKQHEVLRSIRQEYQNQPQEGTAQGGTLQGARDIPASSLLNDDPKTKFYAPRTSSKVPEWTTQDIVVPKSQIDSALNALAEKTPELSEQKRAVILEHLLELAVVLAKDDCSFRRSNAGRNRNNYKAFGYFAASQFDSVKLGDADTTKSGELLIDLINRRNAYKSADLNYLPVEILVKEGWVVAPQVGINYLGKIGAPQPPITELAIRNQVMGDVTVEPTVGEWFDAKGIYDVRMELQATEDSAGDMVLQAGGDPTSGADTTMILEYFPKLLDALIANPDASLNEIKRALS